MSLYVEEGAKDSNFHTYTPFQQQLDSDLRLRPLEFPNASPSTYLVVAKCPFNDKVFRHIFRAKETPV